MGVYSDDLLFIHIPKTGGTSAKAWLWEHLPGARGQWPGDDPAGGADRDDGGLPIGHVPLMDVERFTGRAPDSFQRIVAIIRDPYEQQLSQWMFWRERYAAGQMHPHDIAAARHARIGSWLGDPMSNFHLWYEQTHGERRRLDFSRPDAADYGGYYRYWLTVDGRIPPNVTVVHMERMADEWPAAVRGFVPDDAPPLPRRNVGSRRPYPTQAYYTPEAARIVEAKFAWAFSEHYPRWA